jgi:ribonuclease HI
MNSNHPQYYLLAEARFPSDGEAATQWHFLLEAADGSARLDIAEEEPDTPSDRVELLALVRGLEALDQPARVSLITPSRYVSHGLRFGLDQWRENGWQWEAFGQMTPVKNVDLWQRIDQALTIHRVECRSIRNDAAQTEIVAQPHKKGAEMVANSPSVRSSTATRTQSNASATQQVTLERIRVERTTKTRKPPREQVDPVEPKKPGLWNSMRSGVAGWLHGLGEAVAPRQICT